jgi:hypothetical protein
MLDLRAVMEWAMAIIASLGTGGLIYWVIALVPRGRILRCPETGAMTFVEIGCASPGDGSQPKVTVQSCDLWPEHDACDRGCLVRQKWGLWQEWREVHNPYAGAKYRTSPLSLETCI